MTQAACSAQNLCYKQGIVAVTKRRFFERRYGPSGVFSGFSLPAWPVNPFPAMRYLMQYGVGGCLV